MESKTIEKIYIWVTFNWWYSTRVAAIQCLTWTFQVGLMYCTFGLDKTETFFFCDFCSNEKFRDQLCIFRWWSISRCYSSPSEKVYAKGSLAYLISTILSKSYWKVYYGSVRHKCYGYLVQGSRRYSTTYSHHWPTFYVISERLCRQWEQARDSRGVVEYF